MRFFVGAVCISSEVVRFFVSADGEGCCIEINPHEKKAIEEVENILKENKIQATKYGENGFILYLGVDDSIEVLP